MRINYAKSSLSYLKMTEPSEDTDQNTFYAHQRKRPIYNATEHREVVVEPQPLMIGFPWPPLL